MLNILTARRYAFQTRPCVKRIAVNLRFFGEKATLDAQKMLLFQQRSSSWWDEKGEWKTLHSLNKLRIPLVLDGLIDAGKVRKALIGTTKPLQNLLILDAGCGGGILAEPLARLGATVRGVDPSKELIEVAKQHAILDPSLSNLTYWLGTVEDHAMNNSERYDAVVVCEVLAHVADQDLFLQTCVKCLKPGGSIFISTINKTVAMWLLGAIVYERLARAPPRGIHRWDRLITPIRTQNILENNDCSIRFIRGFWYNPFINKWYWTSNKSFYYALRAVKG